MGFIDIKADGGTIQGKIAFYCDTPKVTRQGFYRHLKHRDDPWKYGDVAGKMRRIADGDGRNDAYGRRRMHQALKLECPDEDIPGERTVCRIMGKMGSSHKPDRKPDGMTKAGRNAGKPDDLFKRDFTAGKPPGNA